MSQINNISASYNHSFYGHTPGVFGQALESLTNTRLTFSNESLKMVLGGDFSISAWVSKRVSIVFNSRDSGKGKYSEKYLFFDINLQGSGLKIFPHLSIFSSTFSSFYTNNTFDSSQYDYSSIYYNGTQILPDRNFHHVVIQRKNISTSSYTEFYLNGQLVSSETEQNKLFVGLEDTTSYFAVRLFSRAKIDDLMIFDFVLSSEDVENIFREGNANSQST